MSFQFPHSARLTPPVCANAWKTAECDSLPGIWLAVVFLCAECVPDVSPPLFCVSLFRGVVWIVFDFVYLFIYLYYDALKGLWCVDWKWNPPPPFHYPSIHPSLQPRPGCVWGSEQGGGGFGWCENGVTSRLSEIWEVFARWMRVTAAPRERLQPLCVRVCRATLGRAAYPFPPSHHQACGLDEEHLAACVLQLRPACLPVWMSPCWSLKNTTVCLCSAPGCFSSPL